MFDGSEHTDRTDEVMAAGCDEESRIEADEPCLFCGYNLKHQLRCGRCPECGHGVEETLFITRIWTSDGRGKDILWGAALLGIAPLATLWLVLTMYLMEEYSVSWQVVENVVTIGSALILPCWLAGILLIVLASVRVPPVRTWLAPLTVLCVVDAGVVGYLFFIAQVSAPSWLEMVGISAPIAFIVANTVALSEIRRLMDKAGCRGSLRCVGIARWLTWLAVAALCMLVASMFLWRGGIETFAWTFFGMILAVTLAISVVGWKSWADVRRLRAKCRASAE